MLIFQKNTWDEICTHAQREYPVECCGILLGRREKRGRIVHQVIPTNNVAEEDQKSIHFLINPLEFVHVEHFALKEGQEIVGFYHSHPDYDESVSAEDTAYMIAGYSYLILSIKKRKYVSSGSYEKITQEAVLACREEIIREK